MTNAYQPFTILRNAIVNRIKYFILNHISEFSKFADYQIKIPFVSTQDVCDIFKQKNLWLKAFYSIDENREPVSGIFEPFLISKSAERLAGRSSDYYADVAGLRKLIAKDESSGEATAFKITVVGVRCFRHHFIAYGLETGGLKPQGESSASCKQVEYQLLFRLARSECLVYQLAIICHL